MSYLVLARKYRSKTFDDVVGQEHVARTLKRAIETDRIAHAFLFTGTRGVGKTSMARILAKSLNCESSDKPTTKPCDKCISCKSITSGEDMDVIEIDAASNTSVDDVREIIENSRFRPARARSKVYIIDEVHMLSRNAFNALLKTLEEPPSHVKFILATTETEKVPATILSRCQRYDFRNIPTREIQAHLNDVCKKEGLSADDDALFMVAKAGAGSMRDALSLLDRLLSLGEKKLTIETIEQMLGLPRTQVLFDLAGAIGAGNVREVLCQADKTVREGLSPESLASALADHLRNLLILVTCGKDSELVEVPGMSIDELVEQSQLFDAATLAQSIAILEELRRNLRAATAGRAMLDATLVRITLAEQFIRVSEIGNGTPVSAEPRTTPKTPPPSPAAVQKKKPEISVSVATAVAESPSDENDDLPAVGKVYEGPTRSLGSIMAASKRAHPVTAAPAPAPVVQTDGEYSGVMSRLRETLKTRGLGFDGVLAYGQIVSLGGGQAVIRYSHEHEATALMLERNGKREAVAAALAEILNESIGVKIEIESAPIDSKPTMSAVAPPPRRNAGSATPQAAETPRVPESPPVTSEQKTQILQTDPLVRAVCELFDGDIVKVD